MAKRLHVNNQSDVFAKGNANI